MLNSIRTILKPFLPTPRPGPIAMRTDGCTPTLDLPIPGSGDPSLPDPVHMGCISQQKIEELIRQLGQL